MQGGSVRVIVNEQVAKLTYERDAMVKQVNELMLKIEHIENVLEEGGTHVQWKTKVKGLR